MNKLALAVTKFLSPPYCIGCEVLLSEYTVLCTECLKNLPKIFSHEIKVTPSKLLTVHAYTAYQKPIEKLIQAKLTSQKIPIDQLAFLLSEYSKKISFDSDCLVPIPLHWQRKLWRGFNQAEILADEVGRALHKPVISLLKRRKNTLFQSTLSATERTINLQDAFVYRLFADYTIKNKRILLIDDLYTTGATATAAARELYKHGAAVVELLVVGKVTD